MTAAVRVFLVAEGPSEMGSLDALTVPSGGRKQAKQVEGYMPPMLRKLLGDKIHIEAQKVTTLGRFAEKVRIPGHGEKAAKALSLAAQFGCDVLVFVKDVDREQGTKNTALARKKKLREMHAEIDAGFSSVANGDDVVKIKATPCRMIEAWALGDPTAVARVADKRTAKNELVPARPELLWGDEKDPASNHPKCVLTRILGKAASAEVFEELALEASEATLTLSCPESFAPFAAEAMAAATQLGLSAPRAARARSKKPAR